LEKVGEIRRKVFLDSKKRKKELKENNVRK
jgi:hypothetical protein